ncbi:MAG: CstA-like transporter-associated (seleno)protein [Steroidobacteraceae bacterium]
MSSQAPRVLIRLGELRSLARRASGDDAYERFVAHRRAVHPGEPLPSRREFWCSEVDRKWQGVNRCC